MTGAARQRWLPSLPEGFTLLDGWIYGSQEQLAPSFWRLPVAAAP